MKKRITTMTTAVLLASGINLLVANIPLESVSESFLLKTVNEQICICLN